MGFPLSGMRALLAENRRTLALALPMISGHLGQMLMGWADTIMIGRLGTVPLAACALSNMILMVPFVFGFGMLSAVSVRASLGFGAGDARRSGEALRAGIVMAGLLGLLIAPGIALLLPHLGLLGQPPEAIQAAAPYLLLCSWSAIPALMATASKNFAEALSRPWIPFWILLGAVLLNVFLNWLLIFGNWGFPAWGITGAGVATLIARSLCAVALLAYPFLDSRLSSAARTKWRFPRLLAEGRSCLALGLPVGAMHLAEVGGFACGALMLGWLGTLALAAHQIALTCASTTFMFPLGLSQALSVRIGQARGRGEAPRCHPIALGGILLAAVAGGLFALVFLFGGGPIASLFTSDATLRELTARLLIVAGFFQILDGLQLAASGILRGFEDVRIPMIVGITAYWIVGLPVCYMAGFLLGLGAVGVWMGFSVALLFSATALLARLAILRRRG